ncbi:NR5A2 protein, partial [Atractosteus spatula]|nr:NR5A2 protein [Atractosteus spatula]
MRGGRNKFGPMYKRDRALKQQKKALIRANGFKLEATPPLVSPVQSGLHGLHSVSKSMPPPTPASITPSDYDQVPYGPPAIGVAMQNHVPLPGYQYVSFPNRAIKSEYPDHYTSSPESLSGYPYPDAYQTSSPPSVPQLIVEFLRCDPDELQVQNKILAYLQQEQASRGKLEKLSTFGLMMKLAQTTLSGFLVFIMMSFLFCTTLLSSILKLRDQMKLLHNCWSELLVLDHFYRQVQHSKEGSLLLVTGQEIELSTIATQGGATLNNLVLRGQEIVSKLQSLQVDRREIACFKFLMLFNPDVKLLENHHLVESVQEQVNAALLEYTMCNYPQFMDKFGQLLLRLPEIRSLSLQAEEYLYYKHLSGDVPFNNLLIEMLHAKRA